MLQVWRFTGRYHRFLPCSSNTLLRAGVRCWSNQIFCPVAIPRQTMIKTTVRAIQVTAPKKQSSWRELQSRRLKRLSRVDQLAANFKQIPMEMEMEMARHQHAAATHQRAAVVAIIYQSEMHRAAN